MPIYEYECEKCGVVFEMMQAVSAKPLKTCMGAGCDGKENGKVKRLISAAGFVLKGPGWYATDYPSEARQKGIQEETNAANPGAGSHTHGPGCGHSQSESATPQTSEAAKDKPAKKPSSKPKPVEKKSYAKSPYSGRKKKT